MSNSHPLTRLVARYGQPHGMYLYGEFCLLLTLGLDAFRARHTDAQLRALEVQLRPLSLWPTMPEGGGGEPYDPGHAPDDPQHLLDSVAATLPRPALQLGMGCDLFRACLAWAGSMPEAAGDPAAWFEPSRIALTETLGFLTPTLSLMLDAALPAHSYRLYIYGHAVAEGEAYPGQDLMLGPSEGPPPDVGYDWLPDPAMPGWAAWLPIGPDADPPEELTRLHWLTALNRHVTAVLPKHADRLLTVPVAHSLLEQAERAGYDHELERYVSVPELRLVFQGLLRQGLPLKPLMPILEAMLTALLADLAARPIPPPELERLSRQLPVFSTTRLVGIIRRSMGLGEQPGPVMAWPTPPGPEPLPLPTLEPSERARWEALFVRLDASRTPALAWMDAMRATMPLPLQRTGMAVSWSIEAPLKSGAAPEVLAKLALVRDAQRLPELHRMLMHYLFVTRSLKQVRACLGSSANAPRPATAEAIAMLTEPAWPDWHWAIAQPARWLRG